MTLGLLAALFAVPVLAVLGYGLFMLGFFIIFFIIGPLFGHTFHR
jgi:hypothetical protein